MLEFIPHPLILPVGMIVGLVMSAPVGPVNVLCIQRAIERGVVAGIVAGLGAVLGDGLIALLASLGVGAVAGAIDRYRALLQAIGGVALATYGLGLALTTPRLGTAGPDSAPAPDVGRSRPIGETRWSAYLWDVPTTFALAVTNPGAVLGLFAIFGGLSSYVAVRTKIDIAALVASIMAGGLLWWVVLSMLVGHIRRHIAADRLRSINITAGLMLAIFGIVLLAEVALEAIGPLTAWYRTR